MQQTLTEELLGELMYKGSGGPAILLCVPRWETLLPYNYKLTECVLASSQAHFGSLFM